MTYLIALLPGGAMINQEPQIEPSAFSKLLAIWIVVVVVVIATAVIAGGQVYWWQRSVAKKDRQDLQLQIINLQNEIKVLKANIENGPQNINKKLPLATVRSDKKEKSFKDQLAGREEAVISILQNGNLEQLAKYVHPEKGIRLSPFAYVDLKKDQLFFSEQLPKFLLNQKQYIWGYNEDNGLPIRMNPSEYYKTFIYDKAYADSNEISYNQTNNQEFTTSNCFEIYPQAIIVEYRITESNPKETDNTSWRSLRLVFEAKGQVWFLVGIIHDQWML
jgi:hypothetical protein